MLNQEKYENLLEQTSSNRLFKDSLFSILRKENRKVFVFACMVCVIPSYFISFNQNTVTMYADIVNILLDLILAMFGAVLTAFALLQVFLNKNIIKLFINSEVHNTSSDKSTKSKQKKKTDIKKFELKKTNESFTNILFLNLINIIIIVLLSITLKYIDNDFILFNNIVVSNVICFILTEILISLVIYNVLSVKCIIRDLYIFINLDMAIVISEIDEGEEQKK